ncbi:hypothetical protein MmTuc01_2259 [Methanosarcina mazei Tuc01]|uniref:Uncharacterized protein n=1 Tax=Methanosarcina mazei Tuc01 TaxID=1236903 RepID=M1PZ07_METMZ|nr:hypothetical protein MmTuc01_2259 [Methanosarcina mazei Tuc01]
MYNLIISRTLSRTHFPGSWNISPVSPGIFQGIFPVSSAPIMSSFAIFIYLRFYTEIIYTEENLSAVIYYTYAVF